VDLDDASGPALCDAVSLNLRFGLLFSAIPSCVTQDRWSTQALPADPGSPQRVKGTFEAAKCKITEERTANMLRKFLLAATFAAAITAPLSVNAAEPAAASAPAAALSTSTTSIGTLLDNPTTKAIVTKYLPDLVSNPQIEMARGMTLKQIQSYSSDTVTDEVLGKIDAELAKLPVQK
jgi:hypothetical protein